MLLNYFDTLRRYGVPVTLVEFLDFLGALKASLAFADREQFYFLSRTVLVKDEKHFDKFDRAIEAFFNGVESLEGMLEALIPEQWIRDAFEKELTEEELELLEKECFGGKRLLGPIRESAAARQHRALLAGPLRPHCPALLRGRGHGPASARELLEDSPLQPPGPLCLDRLHCPRIP